MYELGNWDRGIIYNGRFCRIHSNLLSNGLPSIPHCLIDKPFTPPRACMISNYAVIEIFYVVFVNLNNFLRIQMAEVGTAILIPSMDNSGNFFAIRYKNFNEYSQFQFEFTRFASKINCVKLKLTKFSVG